MSPSAASMIHCAEESPKAALSREGVAGEEFSIFGGKPKVILEKKDSMQNERQISVDPISVRESADLPTLSVPLHHLLLPPAASGKFVSCSLPSSASSSPRFELTSAKQKKYKNPQPSNLSRQHSVALGNLERLRENRMQRSKSCGEGRACQPSADFDVWSSSWVWPSAEGQRKRGEGREKRGSETEIAEERRRRGGRQVQMRGVPVPSRAGEGEDGEGAEGGGAYRHSLPKGVVGEVRMRVMEVVGHDKLRGRQGWRRRVESLLRSASGADGVQQCERYRFPGDDGIRVRQQGSSSSERGAQEHHGSSGGARVL